MVAERGGPDFEARQAQCVQGTQEDFQRCGGPEGHLMQAGPMVQAPHDGREGREHGGAAHVGGAGRPGL